MRERRWENSRAGSFCGGRSGLHVTPNQRAGCAALNEPVDRFAQTGQRMFHALSLFIIFQSRWAVNWRKQPLLHAYRPLLPCSCRVRRIKIVNRF